MRLNWGVSCCHETWVLLQDAFNHYVCMGNTGWGSLDPGRFSASCCHQIPKWFCWPGPWWPAYFFLCEHSNIRADERSPPASFALIKSPFFTSRRTFVFPTSFFKYQMMAFQILSKQKIQFFIVTATAPMY